MTRLFCSLAITAFALTTLAAATTVKPMTIEELSRASTAVVEGTAVSSWSQWDASHRLISTYTRFRVGRALKGAPASLVTVKQMGGSVGGWHQKVAGVRFFAPNEQAVLFLRPSVAADGTLAIVGLMQGNFQMQRAADGTIMVSNGVPGVSSYDPQNGVGTVGVYTGSKIPLRELESRVQKAGSQ